MSDKITTDEHWQVGNANFYLIMKRYQERERQAKMARHQQEPERPEKTSYLKEIVKGLLVLVAGYIGIMVIVGLVR